MNAHPKWLAALALFAPLLSHAQLTDEDMCRNGTFPSQTQFRIATVAKSAAPKVHLLKDYDGCPQKGGAACHLGPYVIPGDELLLAQTRGQWTCAWFSGKQHESVGWVDNAALAVQTPQGPVDWTGRWKIYDSPGHLDIVRKGGRYYINGKTTHPTPRSENLGQLAGELKVDGSHAHLGVGKGADQCEADLTRIGRFLVIRDNEACGGVGVRFNGVYTRR